MQEANGLTKDTDIKQEKILKLKLAFDTEENAYRILNEYLLGNENIPGITDKVYAMGKTIGLKSEILQRETNYRRKNKLSNGNRREKVEGRDEKNKTTDSKSQQRDLSKNSKEKSDSQRERTIE